MSHQVCLKLPLLCMMVFSMIVGREQEQQRFMCADLACSIPISEAEGLNHHPALTEEKLAFRKQAKIQILGKPIGAGDFWIGRVDDKVGLVPVSLVREQRMLIRELHHVQRLETLQGYWKANIESRGVLQEQPSNDLPEIKYGTNSVSGNTKTHLDKILTDSGSSKLGEIRFQPSEEPVQLDPYVKTESMIQSSTPKPRELLSEAETSQFGAILPQPQNSDNQTSTIELVDGHDAERLQISSNDSHPNLPKLIQTEESTNDQILRTEFAEVPVEISENQFSTYDNSIENPTRKTTSNTPSLPTPDHAMGHDDTNNENGTDTFSANVISSELNFETSNVTAATTDTKQGQTEKESIVPLKKADQSPVSSTLPLESSERIIDRKTIPSVSPLPNNEISEAAVKVQAATAPIITAPELDQEINNTSGIEKSDVTGKYKASVVDNSSGTSEIKSVASNFAQNLENSHEALSQNEIGLENTEPVIQLSEKTTSDLLPEPSLQQHLEAKMASTVTITDEESKPSSTDLEYSSEHPQNPDNHFNYLTSHSKEEDAVQPQIVQQHPKDDNTVSHHIQTENQDWSSANAPQISTQSRIAPVQPSKTLQQNWPVNPEQQNLHPEREIDVSDLNQGMHYTKTEIFKQDVNTAEMPNKNLHQQDVGQMSQPDSIQLSPSLLTQNIIPAQLSTGSVKDSKHTSYDESLSANIQNPESGLDSSADAQPSESNETVMSQSEISLELEQLTHGSQEINVELLPDAEKTSEQLIQQSDNSLEDSTLGERQRTYDPATTANSFDDSQSNDDFRLKKESVLPAAAATEEIQPNLPRESITPIQHSISEDPKHSNLGFFEGLVTEDSSVPTENSGKLESIPVPNHISQNETAQDLGVVETENAHIIQNENIAIVTPVSATNAIEAEILETSTPPEPEVTQKSDNIFQSPNPNQTFQTLAKDTESVSEPSEQEQPLPHDEHKHSLESGGHTERSVDEVIAETLSEQDQVAGTEDQEAMRFVTHTHTHPPKTNPLLEHTTLDNTAAKIQKCYPSVTTHGSPSSEDHGDAKSWDSMRYLLHLLVGFLPKHMQDNALDTNGALIFTSIVALTLIFICIPYVFIESFLSVRPLKKKVTDLSKTLWKVNTALASQQLEYEAYKEKALMYDEDKKQLEKLETELYLVQQIEVKLKLENRNLKKRINNDVKVAEELEALITTTINQRDEILEDRNKLRNSLGSLQTKHQETVDQLESLRTLDAGRQMEMELLKHSKDNLELRLLALEKEAGELKVKLSSEIELRRSTQALNDSLTLDKNSAADELLDLKSVLHKYEATVDDLNNEISDKENELGALKESLGEDSPLVDIAEISSKLKGLTGKASSLQARVESLTLENSSLTRELEKSKDSLIALETEKDTARTRLLVLEAYFKEKEDELRRTVENHEAEKELRGKDKDELVKIIQEKSELSQNLNGMLEKLNHELTETKLAHRSEVRVLEAKTHETWLSLCQSERKAQEVRKESEILRQKLTAIAKTKQPDENDAQHMNGDMPYAFDGLDLDDVPLPLPETHVIPSYFGLGDFDPPAPLDDDEVDNELFDLHMNGKAHEPPRPPPLGQLSPNDSDPADGGDLSPIRGLGERAEFSDGSFSPPPPEDNVSRGIFTNGSLPIRRHPPLSASSPYEHGFNL